MKKLIKKDKYILINWDTMSQYGVYNSEQKAWKACYRLRKSGVDCEPTKVKE